MAKFRSLITRDLIALIDIKTEETLFTFSKDGNQDGYVKALALLTDKAYNIYPNIVEVCADDGTKIEWFNKTYWSEEECLTV